MEEPIAQEPEVTVIPKMVFIVPYRDRLEQQRFFSFHMKKILEDYKPSEYKIHYIHQTDNRDFNRGALKNIGFLYVKSEYPNDYKNITLVFNDVDTMPYNKNFISFETVPGIVKHFYGYRFALGGIVSINAGDFENVNGFPNYWAWGYEDNTLQQRVAKKNIYIDRSQFYPILDKNILQLKDGITRTVNRLEYHRFVDEMLYNQTNDGINTLSDIKYKYDEETQFLNIATFATRIQHNPQMNQVHDMRNGAKPFPTPIYKGRGRGATMRMSI